MRRTILSFFGAGYLRPAPGTWGSLAALPVAWVLHTIAGPAAIAIGAGLLYAIGVAAIQADMDATGEHDPSWIVIDEVVGQWIALLPVSLGAFLTGEPMIALWPGLVLAFAGFRLFDIWKPWVIGMADARGDALGVMLDDVLAGVFAAISVLTLAVLFHMVFL